MTEPKYGAEEATGLWVFLEQQDGVLESVSVELLGKARQLADQSKQAVTAVVTGYEIGHLAAPATAFGADQVLLAEHRLLREYTTAPHAAVMTQIIMDRKPDILLLGATANGRDLAGRLAVRLRTGLTADCTDLAIDQQSGLLLGEVTGFGHGILATIQCPRHRPQMATVRPGVFPRPVAEPSRTGTVKRVRVRLSEQEQRVQVRRQSSKGGVDITQAERLIVGGRGVQGDFALLRRLARALRAEVGATRWLGGIGKRAGS